MPYSQSQQPALFLAQRHFHHASMTGLPLKGGLHQAGQQQQLDPLPKGITLSELNEEYTVPSWTQVKNNMTTGGTGA
jgi:hypothetical protein